MPFDFAAFARRSGWAKALADGALLPPEALCEAVLNQWNDAVDIADRQGRLVYVNSACERLSGWSAAEMLGQCSAELFVEAPAERAFYLQVWRMVLEGSTWRGQLPLCRRNGEARLYEVQMQPVRDADGTICHVVTLRRQITIEATPGPSNELRRNARDESLSMVFHELRAPITNMKLALRMLRTATSEDQREVYLRIVEAECTRQSSLIDDLLDLQRAEAGQQSLFFEPIDLQQWLPQRLWPFVARTQQRSLRLHVSVEAAPPDFCSDARLLERLLTELVHNACKYTPPGGTINVRAQHQLHCETMRLSVSNSGVEIPTELLQRIFEKFYRVPGGDPYRQGGSGLGLALVKRLVEQLYGRIEVESNAAGTTFQVELPLKPPD